MQIFVDVASILAESVLAGAAFWLGWRVYKYTQLTESINQINSGIDITNSLNQMALSSSENLLAIDGLFDDGSPRDEGTARKRWAIFLALQSHQRIFLAKDSKIRDKGSDFHERMTDQVLDLLLADEDVLPLVQNRGFDSKFADFCTARVRALSLENTPKNGM